MKGIGQNLQCKKNVQKIKCLHLIIIFVIILLDYKNRGSR